MNQTSPRRVAVIGAGHWGSNLVRNFAGLGALAAVSDHRPEVMQRHAETHGVPALDFDGVLADSTIEAVALATPAAMHAAMAIRAIEAGKHVFVEKPIALTVADAEAVIAAAEAHDRVLMIGHLLQYHPAFLELKARVRRGDLGRLRYIYSNRLSLGQFRREENILWSFAPHDLSMILGLTGELPSRVSAVGHGYLHDRIPDVTTTNLSFPSGVNAHVFVSWLHPFKEQKLVVIGEEGMIVFDDTQPWAAKLMLYPHKVAWREGVPAPVKAEGTPIPMPEAEPLRLECEHFLGCIAGDHPPRTDGVEALGVLKVLAAADQSIREGASLPLEAGDAIPAANAGVDKDAFVHESAYVDDGAVLGAGTKVWHFSHVLKGVVIGRNCSFGQNVVVGPDVVIGDGCKVQNNVSLYKGVTLADGVFCGPSCVFTNVLTPRSEVNRQSEFLATPVRRGVTIGANATIVCGHELGEYSMIAAGAVVTRDVMPFALMAGVPARRIGWVSHAGERLGPDLVCPREGRRYRETDDGGLVEER